MSNVGSRQVVRDKSKISELIDLVVTLVGENPGLNTKELTEAARNAGAHCQRGDIGKAANAAVAKGLITRTDGTRNSKHHFPVTSSPEPSQVVKEISS